MSPARDAAVVDDTEAIVDDAVGARMRAADGVDKLDLRFDEEPGFELKTNDEGLKIHKV